MFASLCPSGKISLANVQCDHVGDRLRLGRGKGKMIAQPAAKLIARRPALVRGFAFLGHGSSLTSDQGMKAFGGNDCAPADAVRFQPSGRDVRVERGAAKARRLNGLSDGIAEFRNGEVGSCHLRFPTLSERD